MVFVVVFAVACIMFIAQFCPIFWMHYIFTHKIDQKPITIYNSMKTQLFRLLRLHCRCKLIWLIFIFANILISWRKIYSFHLLITSMLNFFFSSHLFWRIVSFKLDFGTQFQRFPFEQSSYSSFNFEIIQRSIRSGNKPCSHTKRKKRKISLNKQRFLLRQIFDFETWK